VPHAAAFIRTAAPQYGQGLVGVAIFSVPPVKSQRTVTRDPPSVNATTACYEAPVTRRLPWPEPAEGRGAPLEILFEGSPVRAFAGESVAAALFASGTRVLSRSLKYHRPRTFFCLSGHCGGCLVRADGIPNLRACQLACRPGLEVVGQNAYPSPDFDVLGAVDFLFPGGMDHHTLMTGSSILNKVANKIVRQLSGLGTLPVHTADQPEVREVEVDVCVIGAGPAGLAAATAAATAGASVLAIDEQLEPGGSLLCDPRAGIDEAARRSDAARAAGATLWPGSTAVAFYAEESVLAVATPDGLARVRARRWVWATGGYPINALFGDNDRPGVLAARAVARLLVQHRVVAGDRVVIAEDSVVADDAAALAAALAAAGAEVERIPAGEIARARGRRWVKRVELHRGGSRDCDVVAVAAIPAPASEGPRQHGCKVVLDPPRGGFRVDIDARGRTSADGVLACGDVTGWMGAARAAEHGARVGREAVS
jgi:sarcosine oxidase subunit alpha